MDQARRMAGLICYLFFFVDLVDVFFFGTLAPFFLAFESPIAIACFLLFTFVPDLPLFRVPFFRSRIAFSTSFDAFFPYLAIGYSFTSPGLEPKLLFHNDHRDAPGLFFAVHH
jgi:hypothetical protein